VLDDELPADLGDMTGILAKVSTLAPDLLLVTVRARRVR